MTVSLGKVVFGGLISAVLLAAPVYATPIGVGQFNLSGTIDVTGTSVLFGYNTTPPPPPGDQTAGIVKPLTGPFSDMKAGQTATIMDITSSPSYPSGAISLTGWVVLPDGISLDLTNIPFNTSVPVCTGTSADNFNGNSCRPNATSPIILSESSTGVTAVLNAMGVAYTGTASSGSTPYTAGFNAFFTESGENTISGLLSTFKSQGYITTGYQANFSTVPEPDMLAGVGLGILLIGLWRKNRKQSKLA